MSITTGRLPFNFSFNLLTGVKVLKQCDASDEEVEQKIKEKSGDNSWVVLKKDDPRSVFGVFLND